MKIPLILGLENYIQNSPQTFVIVSHAREFLNNVCTHTIYFFKRRLFYFKGNYNSFKQTLEEQ